MRAKDGSIPGVPLEVSPVNVPYGFRSACALFFLTLLVTLPSLYVSNALVGSRLSLVAVCGLCQAARAEIPDCKLIADPAARLTCYDKINPPVATYPIPLPKPTARPLSVPQSASTGYVGSPNEDEALVSAKMNGICRGC